MNAEIKCKYFRGPNRCTASDDDCDVYEEKRVLCGVRERMYKQKKKKDELNVDEGTK